MIYLTSANQANIIAAQAQISLNCGFPNNLGTEQWANVQKAINQDMWFIIKPPIEGYNLGEFTQIQMMSNVDLTNIIEQEYDATWFPSEEGN